MPKEAPPGPSESARPPAKADSEPASAPPSETPSESEGGLIADAGPAFDPAAAAAQEPAGPPPPPEQTLLDQAVAWEADTVRTILEGKGELLHAWKGVAEQDWLYTEADLRQLTPPLVRLLNRYLPELAEYADPAVIGAMFMKYATRSLGERRRAIAAAEAGQVTPPPVQSSRPQEGPPRSGPAAAPAAAPDRAAPPAPKAAPAAAPAGPPPEVDAEAAPVVDPAAAGQAKLEPEELEALSWERGG